MSADPVVAAEVHALERQRRRAHWIGGAGIVTGIALVAVGVALMKSPPDDCPDACFAEPHPATWPLVAGGLTVAVGGGAAGYFASPPERATAEIVERWNHRHPDRRLTLLDVPCAEGERCPGKRLSVPLALASDAFVHPVRGSRTSAYRLESFSVSGIDLGRRRESLRALRSSYERTLDHSFNAWVGGAPLTCHEWSFERGRVDWGHSVRGNLGAFRVEDTRDTTYTAGEKGRGAFCDLGAGRWRLQRREPGEGDFVLHHAAGQPTGLVAKPYRGRRERRFSSDETIGFVIEDDGRVVALVDVSDAGLAVLSASLAGERRTMVGLVAVALVLYADRTRAPSSYEQTLRPVF